MYKAAAIIRIPSISPEKSSYLPWPKLCSLSAGSEDFDTEKSARNEAIRSLRECIASDIILIEPEIIPAVSFKIISVLLEKTETRAANFFS